MKHLRFTVLAVVVSVLVIGCAWMDRHTPTAPWGGNGLQSLGEVTACDGKFCIDEETGKEKRELVLLNPPDDWTVRTALRQKAADAYDIPEEEVILGEITLKAYSAMGGTIRGWKATASVAHRE